MQPCNNVTYTEDETRSSRKPNNGFEFYSFRFTWSTEFRKLNKETWKGGRYCEIGPVICGARQPRIHLPNTRGKLPAETPAPRVAPEGHLAAQPATLPSPTRITRLLCLFVFTPHPASAVRARPPRGPRPAALPRAQELKPTRGDLGDNPRTGCCCLIPHQRGKTGGTAAAGAGGGSDGGAGGGGGQRRGGPAGGSAPHPGCATPGALRSLTHLSWRRRGGELRERRGGGARGLLGNVVLASSHLT